MLYGDTGASSSSDVFIPKPPTRATYEVVPYEGLLSLGCPGDSVYQLTHTATNERCRVHGATLELSFDGHGGAGIAGFDESGGMVDIDVDDVLEQKLTVDATGARFIFVSGGAGGRTTKTNLAAALSKYSLASLDLKRGPTSSTASLSVYVCPRQRTCGLRCFYGLLGFL